MTRQPKDLSRLVALSRMLLDQDLHLLREAAIRKDTIAARLNGLEPASAPGLDPITEARLRDRYQIWADGKRAEINITLARARAEWLEQRGKAAYSLARHTILQKISTKSVN